MEESYAADDQQKPVTDEKEEPVEEVPGAKEGVMGRVLDKMRKKQFAEGPSAELMQGLRVRGPVSPPH